MNLKNINPVREISFFEIILNFWKFKLFFFYIFLSVLFLNLLLINLIPKKTILQINLDRPDKIYSEILKTYDSKNILIPEYLYFQDYYNNFFESDFLSRNNLEDFAKVNNDKYQLFDYIVKNQIFIKKKTKQYL